MNSPTIKPEAEQQDRRSENFFGPASADSDSSSSSLLLPTHLSYNSLIMSAIAHPYRRHSGGIINSMELHDPPGRAPETRTDICEIIDSALAILEEAGEAQPKESEGKEAVVVSEVTETRRRGQEDLFEIIDSVLALLDDGGEEEPVEEQESQYADGEAKVFLSQSSTRR